MATRIKVDTKGLTQLIEQLALAGQDVDAAIERALTAGGEVAKAGMIERVPKDTHNLEKHIDVTPVKRDGNFSYVEVGVLSPDADTARYGNAQEYGTSSMPATPYLRPTMIEDAGKIRKAMTDSLGGGA